MAYYGNNRRYYVDIDGEQASGGSAAALVATRRCRSCIEADGEDLTGDPAEAIATIARPLLDHGGLPAGRLAAPRGRLQVDPGGRKRAEVGGGDQRGAGQPVVVQPKPRYLAVGRGQAARTRPELSRRTAQGARPRRGIATTQTSGRPGHKRRPMGERSANRWWRPKRSVAGYGSGNRRRGRRVSAAKARCGAEGDSRS